MSNRTVRALAGTRKSSANPELGVCSGRAHLAFSIRLLQNLGQVFLGPDVNRMPDRHVANLFEFVLWFRRPAARCFQTVPMRHRRKDAAAMAQ